MSFGDSIGWLAAALTLVSFSMRSMAGLSITAIGANLAFIAYGASAALSPVLILHLLLLPCNLVRLREALGGRKGDAQDRLRPDGRVGPAEGGGRKRDWLVVATGTGRRDDAAGANPRRRP